MSQDDAVRRLCLGTVKLGLPNYGIGSVSHPTHADSAAILREAWALGIRAYDTARAYGDAEDLIDTYLPGTAQARCGIEGAIIVTKSAPDLLPWVVENRAIADLNDPVLLHNPTKAEIARWSLIADGASVYTPEQARAAIQCAGPKGLQHLQLPYCALDQRHAAVIDEAVAAGMTVWARQPFLQGILCNGQTADGDLRVNVLEYGKWASLVRRFRARPVEMALRFALETPAHYVVFGAGSLPHLQEVVQIAAAPAPDWWPDAYAALRTDLGQAANTLASLWA